MRCFIDSNIVVYANDMSEGSKQSRALEINSACMREGNGVHFHAGSSGIRQYCPEKAANGQKMEADDILPNCRIKAANKSRVGAGMPPRGER